MQSELISVGTPVDSWWNDMRACLQPCIGMLASFPAAPDGQAARLAMTQVNVSYEAVYKAPHPKQAQDAWTLLLDSLRHLHISLNAQANNALIDADVAHNIAFNRYTMLCVLLLSRGVYEPVPGIL